MTKDTSPSEAFEALRREVALMRRALEGLSAEQKAQPDYSAVLAGIGERISEQTEALDDILKTPALQLTPRSMAQELSWASKQARDEDARLLGQAHHGIRHVAQQIEAALSSARTAQEQQSAVRWYAVGGVLIGAILMLLASLVVLALKTPMQETVASRNVP